MRLLLLFFPAIVVANIVNAQKRWGFSPYLGSGVSWFAGNGATTQTNYYMSDVLTMPGAADRPYGKLPYTNFILGVQVTRHLQEHWLVQLNAQYERIGGKADADTIYTTAGSSEVYGQYSLYNDYIAINPRIGKTIGSLQIKTTLLAGVDYAFRVQQGHQMDYTDHNGNSFSRGASGGMPDKNDFRLTAGMQFSYRRIALGANYKHGLVNVSDKSGGKVLTRIIHINLLYTMVRLK